MTMVFKKLLATGFVLVAFLSAGRMAFAESVSASDILNSDAPTHQEVLPSEAPSEVEQEVLPSEAPSEVEQEVLPSEAPSEVEQILTEFSSEPEKNGGANELLSDEDDEEKPGENDTQDDSIIIVRQPEDRYFVPGYMITLSLQAEGTDLQYQWYYKKRGENSFSVWKNRTHSSESVAPNESWDGIELYCLVSDTQGNSVRSDTVMACIDDSKTILAVGDSICRGSRNGYRGFVGDLGLPYINAGVNGATLAVGANEITDIPSLLAEIADYSPEIIIAEGGVNDYVYNAPLGEIPSVPLSSSAELDETSFCTTMGGLQRLLLTMAENYPNAERYFLITHKTTQRQGKTIDGKIVYTDNDTYKDWTVSPNRQGYTQQDIHDTIVQCCRVYGVEVIDIYDESPLNTVDLYYCSDISYTNDNSVTDNYYVDIDGIHPLSLGYREYYVPEILKHIDVSQPIKELSIVGQPVDTTVSLGDPVTLSLTAQGSFLKYQWYFKKEGQSDFRPWPNRVLPTETVTPNESWDGIQLYCVVTDKRGNSVDSDIITVTVEQELAILQQPVNSSVTLGEPLTLSVKAQGIGLKYQWYYRKKGQESFREWPNRVLPTETVTPNASWNGIQLYCRVTDKRGNSVESDTVTVMFDDTIVILQQPESQTVLLGDSITLSVKADGTGLKYQWYYKKAGQDSFSSYRTNATETVTPNATWDGIQLYCTITDIFGNSVDSDIITVTIEQELAILQQPVNSSVTLGDSLTLSLKAQGTGLQYQWYYKKEGQKQFSPWKNHTNASESVTPNATWDGIQLYCTITDKYGNSAQSDVITVKVVKKYE